MNIRKICRPWRTSYCRYEFCCFEIGGFIVRWWIHCSCGLHSCAVQHSFVNFCVCCTCISCNRLTVKKEKLENRCESTTKNYGRQCRAVKAGLLGRRLSSVLASAPTVDSLWPLIQKSAIWSTQLNIFCTDLRCGLLWLISPFIRQKWTSRELPVETSLKSSFGTFRSNPMLTGTVGPVATRSPNMNIVWAADRKLLTDIAFRYFSVRHNVYSSGRASFPTMPASNLAGLISRRDCLKLEIMLFKPWTCSGVTRMLSRFESFYAWTNLIELC